MNRNNINLEAAVNYMLSWSKENRKHIQTIHFSSLDIQNDAQTIWIFLDLDRRIEEYKASGEAKLIIEELYSVLLELKYPKEKLDLAQIKFDSEENVKNNYSGSYFYRFR